jgi:tetratricopeptide (TPR) repeat protein
VERHAARSSFLALALLGLALVPVAARQTDPAHTDRLLVQPPKPGDRIQVNGWVDSELGINDPLYQIVRVLMPGPDPDDSAGSGFLLPGCRVMTVAHVAAMAVNNRTRAFMATVDRNDLIGQRLAYETRPLPALAGKKATGHFRIIGHSVMTADHRDWAVGYDDECLSVSLKLGVVEPYWLDPTKYFDAAKPRDFMTAAGRKAFESDLGPLRLFSAGYSDISVPGIPHASWPLYVDSRCRFSSIESAQLRQNLTRLGRIETNCSIWYGGSGQPLLAPLIVNGRLQRDASGRPRLLAFGMAESGTTTGSRPPFEATPSDYKSGNVRVLGTKFEGFVTSASADIRRLLDAPMTAEWKAQIDAAGRARDLDDSFRGNFARRFPAAPEFAPPRSATALRDCLGSDLTAKDAEARCTAALQIPSLSRQEIIDALVSRARWRQAQSLWGTALRDDRSVLGLAKLNGMARSDPDRLIDLELMTAQTYAAAGWPLEARHQLDDAMALLLSGSDTGSGLHTRQLLAASIARAEVNDRILPKMADPSPFNEPLDVTFLDVADDYSRAIGINPTDPQLWLARSYAYASYQSGGVRQPIAAAALGFLQKALADANKVLELAPGSAEAIEARGFANLKMRMFDNAFADFDAALRIDARRPVALFGRGLVKRRRQQIDGGDDDIEEAARLDPRIEAQMGRRNLWPVIVDASPVRGGERRLGSGVQPAAPPTVSDVQQAFAGLQTASFGPGTPAYQIQKPIEIRQLRQAEDRGATMTSECALWLYSDSPDGGRWSAIIDSRRRDASRRIGQIGVGVAVSAERVGGDQVAARSENGVFHVRQDRLFFLFDTENQAETARAALSAWFTACPAK